MGSRAHQHESIWGPIFDQRLITLAVAFDHRHDLRTKAGGARANVAEFADDSNMEHSGKEFALGRH